MIDFGYITKQNLKEPYLIWPQITHHLSRILIIGSSRSGKTNALLNLIIHKLCTEEMYLYARIHMNENTTFQLINAKVQT